MASSSSKPTTTSTVRDSKITTGDAAKILAQGDISAGGGAVTVNNSDADVVLRLLTAAETITQQNLDTISSIVDRSQDAASTSNAAALSALSAGNANALGAFAKLAETPISGGANISANVVKLALYIGGAVLGLFLIWKLAK